MGYQAVPRLAGVWGLQVGREYSDAEIKDSVHLREAIECGALVADEPETKKSRVQPRDKREEDLT